MGAVGWMTAGAGALHGLASASATWMSVGMVRWATPRRVRAWRMARSTRVGICAGTWIISLYSATSMNSFSSATSCW